jgi:RNA polymerase sigma factor (sigma-70 family)
MPAQPLENVLGYLRAAACRQEIAATSDGDLLESFVLDKDEASFAALVYRHGPMVMGVCRRILRNHHDVEDAFQAIFLILASRGSTIQPRSHVANWLHGVTFRVAQRLRATSSRRSAREKSAPLLPARDAFQEVLWAELQAALDHELSLLPKKYRLPIVLCDLQGLSIRDATTSLSWKQGTLAGRLARGRLLLAERLRRRGLTLSGGALATLLAQSAASAGIPATVVRTAVEKALAVGACAPPITVKVPAAIASFVEETMRVTRLARLKVALVAILLAVACGGGLVVCYSAFQTAESAAASSPLPRESESPAARKVDDAAKNVRMEDPMFPDGLHHDFGLVKRGTFPRHFFRIVNISREPLRLTSVRVSSGCVEGTLDHEVLQPEQVARLTITLDTKRFLGAKALKVILTTEGEKGTSHHDFTLQAESRDEVLRLDQKVDLAFPRMEMAMAGVQVEQRGQGLLLAGSGFSVQKDGRVKLTDCGVARLRYPQDDPSKPRVESRIYSEYGLFTLDRPIRAAADLESCRILSVEFAGGDRMNFSRPGNSTALLTAATSSGPVRSGPIGAATIGCSIPSRSQKSVLINTQRLVRRLTATRR